MATISAAIALQDNFSSVMTGIIGAIGSGVSALEKLHKGFANPLDTSTFANVATDVNNIRTALQELAKPVDIAINAPTGINIPKPVLEAPELSMEAPEAIHLNASVTADKVNVPQDAPPINATAEISQPPAVPQPEPTTVQVIPDVPPVQITTNVEQPTVKPVVEQPTIPPMTADVVVNVPQVQPIMAPVNAEVDTSSLNNFVKEAMTATGQAQDLNSAMNAGVNASEYDVSPEINRDRQAVEQLTASINQGAGSVNTMGNNIQRLNKGSGLNFQRVIDGNIREQDEFNQMLRQGQEDAENLAVIIKGFASAYAGYLSLDAIGGFINECTSLFDTQLAAETQLVGVLNNMQEDAQGVADAFDAITKKASEVQGKGIYGDEAMIAAGAEFSTYFTDTKAIETMMDTLSNYAMGMSGGGSLDNTAMVNYATSLAKMTTGAYDAMTKKGFEVTDAQKAIIEGTADQATIAKTLGQEYVNASKDVQAAQAIAQIVNASWDGLYERMSDTPQGKIIQMNNTWGDMKEIIGKELYPYLILFVDTVNNNWPAIQGIVDGITTALKYLLFAISTACSVAMAVASTIVQYWNIIGPIVYGVAGAFIAYNTALAISNAITAITIARQKLANALAMINYVRTIMSTKATLAFAMAQMGLNTAMLACPLTWVVMGIFAVIMAVSMAIGIFNQFAGTSVSTVGIIVGAFRMLGSFIANIFIFVMNMVDAVAVFLGSVFVDPLAAIHNLFATIWNGVIDLVGKAVIEIVKLMGKIPGLNKVVNIDPELNLDSFKMDYKKIDGVQDFKPTEMFDYHEQALAGYSWGSSLSIDSMVDPVKAANDPMNLKGNGGKLDSIADNTDKTAKSAKAMKDAMDIMDEDLKFFRDVAEAEVVNKYTTASVNIKVDNQNNISNGVDASDVLQSMYEQIREATIAGGEAVHV